MALVLYSPTVQTFAQQMITCGLDEAGSSSLAGAGWGVGVPVVCAVAMVTSPKIKSGVNKSGRLAKKVLNRSKSVIQTGLKKSGSTLKSCLAHSTLALKKSASLMNSVFEDVPRPTPKQSMLLFARGKVQQAIASEVRQTVNRMEMVGMEKHVLATAIRIEKSQLSTWLRAELLAKNFPECLIDAVVAGAGSAQKYAKLDGKFTHTPDGRSHLYKFAVWFEEQSGYVDAAIICSNASFQTARVIQGFLQTQEPIFRSRLVNRQMTESGLFGNYQVVRQEEVVEELGQQTTRTPIFRENVMTTRDLEDINIYLEHQACCEAADLD